MKGWVEGIQRTKRKIKKNKMKKKKLRVLYLLLSMIPKWFNLRLRKFNNRNKGGLKILD